MFDSGIKASEIIEQIKDEADIAVPISDGSYVLWLNALEQMLYTELIREQGKTAVSGLVVSTVGIGTLTVQKGEAPIRYEDIYAVYADKKQLIESTVASGTIFKDTYYKTGNDVGINLSQKANTITFIYIVKPALKTASNISSTNVMVPLEFSDLVKAKLGDISRINVYGQEKEPATYRLAKMNLALRGISHHLGGEADSTFTHDLHKGIYFNYIMANPPFNLKGWYDENLKNDSRWADYVTPPESNANYAWILNMVSKLSSNGVAGFILANGALSADGTEGEIRLLPR